MAEDSGIEWTTHTFNHVRGCTKVSPGCANCYAETMSGRNPGTLGVWGPNGTRVVAAESYWRQPLKWNRQAKADRENCERAAMMSRSEYDALLDYERPRVFCASLADVFEDWRGLMCDSNGDTLFVGEGGKWTANADPETAKPVTMDNVRMRLFALIADTPELDWLLLTKRPEFMRDWLADFAEGWNSAPAVPPGLGITRRPVDWPFPNVWLGVSVEDQQRADERIPLLLQTPAAVRFISAEPLLGPIRLFAYDRDMNPPVMTVDDGRLSWVIVGGESGPGARPMAVQWASGIVSQCRVASVPVFVKQLGSSPLTNLSVDDGHNAYWPVTDRKGGDIEEFPDDLKVREFPVVGVR